MPTKSILKNMIPVIVIAIGTLMTSAPSHAENTAGRSGERQDARDTRQIGRQEARQDKQDCKSGSEKSRADCRQGKRDTKQDARDTAKNIKRN